jgi:hypothetical protein
MIKLLKILNELTVASPKRYHLTQKGIDVINDVNILEKLLEKYNFSLGELQDSEEWVISDILNSWYGFNPLFNKIKLSKDEIIQNLEKMDKSTANDMFENMKSMYIKYGYVEFK